MKRATVATAVASQGQYDFNPRPREEGDREKICQLLQLMMISIHALVKRATGSDTIAKTGNFISIHALVKRATTGNVNKGSQILISIHALVKRAT